MMNNFRVIVWALLGLALWVNYEAWVRDYGAKPSTTPTTSTATPASNGAGPASGATSNVLDAEIPQASTATGDAVPASGGSAGAATAAASPAAEADASAGTVHVRTDVLDLQIDLRGGTLVRADLPAYPQVKGQSTPVRILRHDSEDSLYVVQTGLTGGAANEPYPTHLAVYSSAQTEYSLGNATELRVPLTWMDDHGVSVVKTFIFRRGQYRIDLEYDVRNHGDAPWAAASYAQIRSHAEGQKRSMFNVESYAFSGPAIYDGTKYRKLDVSDEDDRVALEVTDGWVAALQHHFVTAIVPPAQTRTRFTLNAEGHHYQLAAAGPLQTIAPQSSGTFRETLFVGPKLQAQLAPTGPELQRVADYGKLTILAQPLFWLLNKVHSTVGNWGVAIIVVTFLLKLLFYPLSEASGRSMAKMKALAPRIKNLQETHKDSREKLGRAMMELYQREKVNPVAGCLPMIIQIPVFLAFYWVLLESVEMRQAPFMGWINDLSSRDPFFILPAIMAGAMFVQYKLNPAPPDPIQAKVFMFMPLVMSVMFAFFPAGLVLYWVTNTLLSIAQQWNINRRIAAAAVKR